MIEHEAYARAQALALERRPSPQPWTRPPLPRGPSLLRRVVARLKARVSRRAAAPKEACC